MVARKTRRPAGWSWGFAINECQRPARCHNTHAERVARSSRVVAADDLRRRLNGQRELLLPPGTIVTPLALEELRTQGIPIRQEEEKPTQPAKFRWGYGQDRAYSMVQTAARAVQRDGLTLQDLPAAQSTTSGWARAVAECVARGECLGGVLFCDNPAGVLHRQQGRWLAGGGGGHPQPGSASISDFCPQFSHRGDAGPNLFRDSADSENVLSGGFAACPTARPVPYENWTAMRIAEVIGNVTLSRWHPNLPWQFAGRGAVQSQGAVLRRHRPTARIS